MFVIARLCVLFGDAKRNKTDDAKHKITYRPPTQGTFLKCSFNLIYKIIKFFCIWV